MNWKDRVGNKLVDAEQAVAEIGSGAVVNIAPYTSTPMTLCTALKAHALRAGLRNIRIDHLASPEGVDWNEQRTLKENAQVLGFKEKRDLTESLQPSCNQGRAHPLQI